MKFKALKHKTLPDTFGNFISLDEGQIRDADTEIFQSDIPILLPESCSIEYLENMYKYATALQQINDYSLVSVELIIADN